MTEHITVAMITETIKLIEDEYRNRPHPMEPELFVHPRHYALFKRVADREGTTVYDAMWGLAFGHYEWPEAE